MQGKEEYNLETGLPLDQSYLERNLPEMLKNSIEAMSISWEKKDRGEADMRWDCNWCELNSIINCAEVEQEITSEQAWYLREKYLRIMRKEDI